MVTATTHTTSDTPTQGNGNTSGHDIGQANIVGNGHTPAQRRNNGKVPHLRHHGDVVVQANGLSKHYGGFAAVDDVTFEVRRGDVFGFLGPNGSGKSTTISMLLGLVEPTSGSISLFGTGPEHLHAALARVGAIIESPAFYPFMSGRANLRTLAELRPGVTRQRVDEVLEIVGLSEAADKKYSNYSLGMKQRLGIGWTLLHDPELLVLDEPANGLDPAGIQEMRHLILQLADSGKTIFISSHQLNEVEQICDVVTIIQRGRIVASGTVAELLTQDDRILLDVSDVAAAQRVLQGIPGIHSVEDNGEYLVVIAPEVRPAVINRALVSAGIEVDELRRSQQTLESAFLDLTGEHPQATHEQPQAQV